MDVDEGAGAADPAVDSTSPADEEKEEDEPDFPDVKLDELLEDFDEMTLGDDA